MAAPFTLRFVLPTQPFKTHPGPCPSDPRAVQPLTTEKRHHVTLSLAQGTWFEWQPRGRVRGRRPPAWRSCALHPLSKARACLPGAGRGARAPRARHPPRPGAVVNPGGGARLALLCVSEGPTGMLRKGFPFYCFSTVPVHTPHAHLAQLMSGDRRGGHSLKELTRHSHVR